MFTEIESEVSVLLPDFQELETKSTTDYLWSTFKTQINAIASSRIPERPPRAKRFWLTRESKTMCCKKTVVPHIHQLSHPSEPSTVKNSLKSL